MFSWAEKLLFITENDWKYRFVAWKLNFQIFDLCVIFTSDESEPSWLELMSPSLAEGFSARLVTFYSQKLAKTSFDH